MAAVARALSRTPRTSRAGGERDHDDRREVDHAAVAGARGQRRRAAASR